MTPEFRWTGWAVVVAQVALGAILVWAGLSKLLYLTEFVQAVARVPFLGAHPRAALLVPALELGVGFALVAWRPPLSALWAANGLFALFLAYQIAIAIQIGPFAKPELPCPCLAGLAGDSGQAAEQIYYVARNTAFLLVAAGCLYNAVTERTAMEVPA